MEEGKHKELVDIMAEFGLPRAVTKTCIYFLGYEKGCSCDIQECMDMTQPEVSNALKFIQNNTTLLNRESIKPKGKGRPKNHYTRKSKEEIAKYLIDNATESIQQQQEKINQLKKLRDSYA